MIKMLKKGKYVRLKNYERKIKSPFMIYANSESILVPQGIGKKNPDKSFTEKYQKHVACSYDYKSVCVEDKFSKSLVSHTSVKLLFTISLIVWLRNAHTVVMR